MYRGGVLCVAMLAATPAAAAVTIGTQIVDTDLAGTIAGMPANSAGNDASAGGGSISAAAQLVERGGGFPAVRATSQVIAELSGLERGRVTFRRSLTPGAGDEVTSSSANYRYLFTIDTSTAFDVNWGVGAFGTGADGQAPAQMLSLSASGSRDTLFSLGQLGDGASGAGQVLLNPGSYELRIADAFGPVASAGTASGLSSQYSFALRAVPEPATWVMLIMGFGTVGGTLRYRRSLEKRRNIA